MAERDDVLKIFNQEATSDRPPTLEEFPMGGDYQGSLADFSREHLALKEQGSQDGLLPPDRPLLFAGGREDILTAPVQAPRRGANAAFNEVFSNAQISGDQTRIPEKLAEARVRTVQDEAVDILLNAYQDDEFKTKTLQNLDQMPREEQLRVLNFELEKRDAQKVTAREALLIHVMRAGHHDMTITQFDKVKAGFNPTELDQFRLQLRDQQVKELRQEVDKIVARRDIGTTGEAVGQFVAQDLIPIYNVVSRMGLSNSLENKVDGETGWFRSLFPGEVRQEIRERFAAASPEERLQYVRDIGDEIERLKNGPYGGMITEYGILENLMEIFTEDLLQENLPKNTLDRVLGNLDVVLESVFNVGLLIKVGGRTTRQAFRSNNQVQTRRTARATGNHRLNAKLDNELQLVIKEAGIDAADSALVHLPKPPTLYDNREVLPDDLKAVVERGERVRDEILLKSDDLTGIGLTTDDKVNVVRKEVSELDSHDTMAVNPKMSVLQALPNDTGFTYRAVYGQTPEQGWDNIYDVVDELLEVDPNVENFRILRRNEDGELERITLTPDEFARLAVKGEIPEKLLPVEPGQRLAAQMINGTPVSTLGDDQIIELSAMVPKDSREFAILSLEARRRANGLPVMGAGDALRAYGGDEFFLEVDHTRYFSYLDKEWLGAGTWRNTPGLLPRSLVPPNRKFGDEIFAAFDRAYRIEQGTIARFEQIYEPYYRLSKSDKEAVTNVMEYVEQYAKDHGELPNIEHLYAHVDGLTPKQMEGVVALQQGLNTQWELFNRRLYREFHTQGYRSAIPKHDSFPSFHGKDLELEELGNGRTVYNPVTQKQEAMSKADLVDFYNSGGRVYKIDLAIDVPGDSGATATLIKVDPADYQTGKLSTNVLEYHPGYYSRFYEDPFYIIKQSNKSVDGNTTDLVEDAIRTAGSVEEAERFVRRFAQFDPKRGVWVNNEDPSKTYRVQRAAQLDQVESSLFAKQSLHREGRLFWDKRNFDRLPDVNGNRAQLEDPLHSLQRSLTMATRQTTHEDLMKSMKTAFGNEFRDLLPDNYNAITIGEVIDHLNVGRKNAVEPATKNRYDQAIEFAKYMRMQLGTDNFAVPFMREQMTHLAAALSRMAGKTKMPLISEAGFKLSRAMENYATKFDPLRTMRSAAFNVFMVFRPVRQVFLQAAQISFLTALDPAYIASGKVLIDSRVLNRGLKARRVNGYDDGISHQTAAKLMGLTKRQYHRLLDEYDRSGLFDTVDVHSFSGGAHEAKAKSFIFQKWERFKAPFRSLGFDLGEQTNLGSTYMVALRRYMRENDIDDLMKLSKSQWDDIGTEAQQLALGMTKPNKMAYQTGILANVTQFLSFSHKATMTLLGQNPALRKGDAWKLAFTGYAMWGANMFGAGEWARGKLNEMGLDRYIDRQLPGFGGTVGDLLAYGLIQKAFNTILSQTVEDHKDVDFGFVAPGVNAAQLWTMGLEAISEAPYITFSGPGGQVVGSFMESLGTVNMIYQYGEMSHADKALRSMDMMLRNFPQYNDAVTAAIAARTNRWVSQSGKVLPAEFEPVWTGMVARGLVGARTVEELAWYEINGSVWQTKENMQNHIETNRDYLLQQLSLYYDGDISQEFLHEQLRTLGAMSEVWPEHLQMEILRQSMILENQEGMSVLKYIAENTKNFSPDITALLDELPDMPQGARDELEEFLNEVYHERVENNKQFMTEELQDTELWQN